MINKRTITALVTLGGVIVIFSTAPSHAAPLARVRGIHPTFFVVDVLPQALLTAPSFVSTESGDHATVTNIVTNDDSNIRITPSYPVSVAQDASNGVPAHWVIESVAP